MIELFKPILQFKQITVNGAPTEVILQSITYFDSTSCSNDGQDPVPSPDSEGNLSVVLKVKEEGDALPFITPVTHLVSLGNLDYSTSDIIVEVIVEFPDREAGRKIGILRTGHIVESARPGKFFNAEIHTVVNG